MNLQLNNTGTAGVKGQIYMYVCTWQGLSFGQLWNLVFGVTKLVIEGLVWHLAY